jgi:hypothetical protein
MENEIAKMTSEKCVQKYDELNHYILPMLETVYMAMQYRATYMTLDGMNIEYGIDEESPIACLKMTLERLESLQHDLYEIDNLRSGPLPITFEQLKILRYELTFIYQILEVVASDVSNAVIRERHFACIKYAIFRLKTLLCSATFLEMYPDYCASF